MLTTSDDISTTDSKDSKVVSKEDSKRDTKGDFKDIILNERILNQWLNLVWFSHVPHSSLLIADSFQTHTNPISQKFMVSRGACLAIIPSACSQRLQPLHRGIKMKFKVIIYLYIV